LPPVTVNRIFKESSLLLQDFATNLFAESGLKYSAEIIFSINKKHCHLHPVLTPQNCQVILGRVMETDAIQLCRPCVCIETEPL